MDPYDLPEEFSHLQAQDMSKLGFMQDLIRGIKKIIGSDMPKETVKEPVASNSGTLNIAPLLRRVLMFLEDGNWREADEYCEKVLDQEPENAQAYLGKLMSELHVHKQDELKDCDKPFDDRNNYQKTMRFAEPALADELKGYITFINDRKENERLNGIYDGAVSMMQDATTESAYRKAAAAFQTILGFKDADALAQQCIEKAETIRKDTMYYSAQKHMMTETVYECETGKREFQLIPGWKDADEQVIACEKKIEEIKAKAEADRLEAAHKAEERRIADEKAAKKRKRNITITAAIVCGGIAVAFVLQTVIIPQQQYHAAEALLEEGDYDAAVEAFSAMGDYKDSTERILEVQYANAEALLESGDDEAAIEIFSELGEYSDSTEQISAVYYAGAEDFLAGGNDFEAAVLFGKAGDYKDAYDRSMELWNQYLVRNSLAAGYSHTVALKSDGTVLAVGDNKYGQCDVSNWTEITSLVAGSTHTIGLKSDGTVLAVGKNNNKQCEVTDWTNIVAVAAGLYHTVGLKSDGTVVAVGENGKGQCDVTDWTNIVAISAGSYYTIGLKSDGTVVAVGEKDKGQCDVTKWTDIVSVETGYYHTVGLKSDGTVVAVGRNSKGQCDVSDWTDIVAIATGSYHTIGLKSDGTVVAVGSNENGECDVSSWTDIKHPE
jgi:tetratricopeptide (TPR) repeat protein